jgi:hypothetical protein
MASIWYEIAVMRFRGKTISGSGPLAVVIDCTDTVILTATPMEADTIKQRPCKPVGCNHGEHRWHRIVELNQPRPSDIRPPIVPAWWADDED